jgi:hypothetical protein
LEAIAYGFGLLPKEFWSLTFHEFFLLQRGRNEQLEMKERFEWERTRWLACLIFTETGERLEYLDGVYNLQILKHMAWMLNPDSEDYEDGLNSLGRGSEARHYHNAIAKALV